MKRIFYFTGHRLTALHWEGKVFADACSFEPDDDGFLKFEKYLISTVNMRTKLLVDVIEEDFRIETVPHVFGKDKKAVIGRLFDRFYRSSRQFIYAETLGREKTGRKDDIVLLGAITNPQLISPWLKIIEECGTPLSGIWTLPLVSKQLLRYIKPKSDSVLLVSQQVNSNLRQTYFKNNKLISSRTSVINQDDDQINQLGVHAEPEISRTLSYLRGQGHISIDEIVEVHVLASRGQIHSLEENLVSSDTQKYYIHDISSIEDDIGLTGLDSKLSDGIFSWLCIKNIRSRGHYGKANEFRQYYYSLASSALYVASLVTFIFAVLVTESNISEAIQYKRSIELLAEQEYKFKQTYDTKFKIFETVLKDAKIMSASVMLANQIKKGSKVNPLDFFIEISKTLSDSKLSDISIDNIEWASEQIITKNPDDQPEFIKTNLVLDYPVQHVAILKGRISVSSDNYRASVKRIQFIVDLLKKNPRINSVTTLTMPVEVRSEKRFSADSGIQSTSKNRSGGQGAFSLEIKMKGWEDA